MGDAEMGEKKYTLYCGREQDQGNRGEYTFFESQVSECSI